MSTSIKRVEHAAANLGLEIAVMRMDDSTRTAADAAKACGCTVAQIVKSLIFKGQDTGDLLLLLVSGANRVDMDKAMTIIGEALEKADANDVRRRTGFAIGGVAPIGHLETPKIWIDETLMQYDAVWAAAGAPNAVFQVTPQALVKATGAITATLAA